MTTDSPIEVVLSQSIQVEQNVTRTLALIKPDAIQAGHKDDIVTKITENGFKIIQEREIHLSKKKARAFYKEHAGKSFYKKLIDWMNSVPVYALVLEKENAIQDWRDLMGPTDSKKARELKPQSIRALFGTDGSQNAVHGSDSEASVNREIEIIFGSLDLQEEPSTSIEQQVQATEVQSIDPTEKNVFTSEMQNDDGPSITASSEENAAESTMIDNVPESADAAQITFGEMEEQKNKETSVEKAIVETTEDGILKAASTQTNDDAQETENAAVTLDGPANDNDPPQQDDQSGDVFKTIETEQPASSEDKEAPVEQPTITTATNVPKEAALLDEVSDKMNQNEETATKKEAQASVTDTIGIAADSNMQIAQNSAYSANAEEQKPEANNAQGSQGSTRLFEEHVSPIETAGTEHCVAENQAEEAQNNGDVNEDTASAAIIDTIVDQYTGGHEHQDVEETQSIIEKALNTDTENPDAPSSVDNEATEGNNDLLSSKVEENTERSDEDVDLASDMLEENSPTATEVADEVPVLADSTITEQVAEGVKDGGKSLVQDKQPSESMSSTATKTDNAMTTEEKTGMIFQEDHTNLTTEASTLQEDKAAEKKDPPTLKNKEAVEKEEANTVLATVPDKLNSTLVTNDDSQPPEPRATDQSEDSSNKEMDNINLSEQENDTNSSLTKQREERSVTTTTDTKEHNADVEKVAVPAAQGDSTSSTDQESKPRLNKVLSSSVINDKKLQLKPKPPIGTTTASKNKPTATSPSGSDDSKLKRTSTNVARAKATTASYTRGANSRIATPSKTRKPTDNKENATTAATMTVKRQTIPSRLVAPSKRTTRATTSDNAAKEMPPKKVTTATTKRASLVSRLTAPTAASARKKSVHASAATTDGANTAPKERLRRLATTTDANGGGSGSIAKSGSSLKKTSPSATPTLKGATAVNRLRVTNAARTTVSNTSANQESQDTGETGKNNENKIKNSVRRTSDIHAPSKKNVSSIPTNTATAAKRLNTGSGVGSRVNRLGSAANTRKEILSKERSSKSKAPNTTSVATSQVKQKANKVKKDDEENEVTASKQARESSAGNVSSHESSPSSSTDAKLKGNCTEEVSQVNDTDQPNDISDDLADNMELPVAEKHVANTTFIGNTIEDEGKQFGDNHDSGSCTPQDASVAIAVSASDATTPSLSQTATVVEDNLDKHDNASAVQASTKKPQMASLRDKFENLSHGATNGNQQHTTAASKDILSRSPNRISDMINRFTKN